MELNPNIILQGKTPTFDAPDPMAQYGKALQLKGMLTQQTLQDQSMADDQAARQAFSQSGGDQAAYLKSLASSGNFKAYQAALKAQQDAEKAKAETGYKTAQTSSLQGDIANKAIAQHRDALSYVNSPQDAAAWVKQGYEDPVTGKILGGLMPLDQAIQRIPTDPVLFNQWKQQAALGATNYIKENAPKYQTNNLGGKTVTMALPGLGGAPTMVASQANTVSPDAQLSANISRANNQATIAKDYKLQGIDPQTGNFVGLGAGGAGPGDTGLSGMVDALGTYKMNPNQAFSRMPPSMRANLISQVQAKYPDYDPTTYDAKSKGARDFSTGALGNSMRSFAVAGQHLDQLNTLVDALGNNNLQVANQVANAYSKQTGNPAPTNFDAAKDVVSKEVVKAIVAGGGGVAERAELAHLMDKANSPAQLKGVISQYRNLMAAQHDALLQQRRAAGLPDSTLPKYQDENGSPAQASVNQPKTFDSLPDPSTLAGKRIQGPDGKIMRSNGTKWIQEK